MTSCIYMHAQQPKLSNLSSKLSNLSNPNMSDQSDNDSVDPLEEFAAEQQARDSVATDSQP
jgi:hypothetical protein